MTRAHAAYGSRNVEPDLHRWSANAAIAPASRTHAASFPLVAIHFEFKSAEFATHYTVVNTLDPAGLLDLANATYSWTLKPPDNDTTCNNHGVLTGTDKEFVWRHGNVGEPGHDDGCHHDIGLPSSGHQGAVTVQVKDSKWSCTASYTGTQAADGAAIGEGPRGSCDAIAAPPMPPPPPPPPPAPPPPPSKCKCLLLTARIVPSTLKLKLGKGPLGVGDQTFTFAVHWVLNCSSGSGGCNGHLSVQQPRNEKRLYFHWHPSAERTRRSSRSAARVAARRSRTERVRSSSTRSLPAGEPNRMRAGRTPPSSSSSSARVRDRS